MKIKTNELEGAALDWAVAKAEGYYATIKPSEVVYAHPNGDWHHNGNWRPSIKWVQGGPIIEREGISNELQREDLWQANKWQGRPNRFWYGCGDKPLIAAMRCYVASKLGDEVEVPDELKEAE